MSSKKKFKEVIGEVHVKNSAELNDSSPEEIAEFLKEFAIEKLSKAKFLNSFINGFADVEYTNTRVCDIVMKAEDYSLLRNYGRNEYDVETTVENLKKGLMGTMWGAYIWVRKDAKGVKCFGEGSKELKRLYPEVAKAKEIMKI